MALKLPPMPVEYLELNYLDAEANTSEYTKLQNEQLLPFAVSGVVNASLKSAKYLTNGDDVKTVIEICLSTEGSDIQYSPGNSFGIIPQNSPQEVNKIIDRLNLHDVADKLFNLSVKQTNSKKKNKVPMHVPLIGTIRDVLTQNLDIRSVPKKTFLRALTNYTTNEVELNVLNELCSIQGAATYTTFITSEYITLLALLHKFPSCLPPFSLLLEHLPRLQPRPYSVASSPCSNSEIRFVFSLTELPNLYRGVCTSWLKEKVDNFLAKSVDSSLNIPIYLRKPNAFQLPTDLSTNIVLVCSGTGLAPFISFLEHRARSLQQNTDVKLGTAHLYYGCRYANRDYLYKTELKEYLNTGVFSKLFVCFSRENVKIKYVQDNIRENGTVFINFLFNNDSSTVLYVCGSKSMSDGVFESVVSCLATEKKYSLDEARKMAQHLKSTNRYIEDIWT
ncbi:uncharacterized protein CBL_07390 [Carabus blaptoides fortunei]